MKLLHKLLPVATIASVAAVVTPLVTSCGSTTCSWEKGQDYKPMTPKKEQHYDTEKDVIEAYNADLKSNKKIYSDDFVYFQSQGKQTYSYIDGEMKKITHTVSSVGDIKEYESMIGTEPKSIGFPISLEMTLDATITVHGDGYTGTLEYKNSKMTLTNIPVRCVDRSIVNVDLLTDHYILNDTSWKLNMPEIKIDKSGKTLSLGTNNIDYTLESATSISEVMSVFSNIFVFFIACESNYYSQATVGE